MPPTQQIRVLMQLRLLSPVSCLLTLENPCRQPPTPGYPPGLPAKTPLQGPPYQQLATVQKGPPRTPADRATCHSPWGEGGGGPNAER
jgi:hypothetical protein